MDRFSDMELRLRRLEREFEDARERLRILEARASMHRSEAVAFHTQASPPPDSSDLPLPDAPTPEDRNPTASGAMLFLAGRSLIAMGGAYLLRALTTASYVPAWLGAMLGLAYAATWLLLAGRTNVGGSRASARFHIAVSLLIGYPLIWETSTRLAVFGPAEGAALLVGFFALGAAVAWRRALPELGWSTTACALLFALGLALATQGLLEYTVALWGIALLGEWFAAYDVSHGLRWPMALALDVATLLLIQIVTTSHAGSGGVAPSPAAAPVAVAAALPCLYLSSAVLRVALRDQVLSWLDALAIVAAFAIGCGGVVQMSAADGLAREAVGGVLVALALASYPVAFGALERQPGRSANFHIATSLGLLAMLAGGLVLWSGAITAAAWGMLGLAALWFGEAPQRVTLRAHGATYLFAAVVSSGLLFYAFDGLFARAATGWLPLTAVGAGVAVATMVGYFVLLRYRQATGAWASLIPHAVVGLAAAVVGAAMLSRGLGGLLGAPGPNADAALLAVVRTTVLCGTSALLVWGARRRQMHELLWIAYPLLVIQAFKLLLEDVRVGRPGTLFLSFGIFGGALVVVSRWVRRDADPTPLRSTATAATPSEPGC